MGDERSKHVPLAFGIRFEAFINDLFGKTRWGISAKAVVSNRVGITYPMIFPSPYESVFFGMRLFNAGD